MNDKLKIIIADDNHTFLTGLQLLLKKNFTCEIIEACKDGKELVQSPNLSKADLLITDINMPEMNGVEAAKRINFQYSNLPMVAITMNLESVYLRQIISVGFKGFVYKPDVSQKLASVIHLVLNKQFVFPDNLKT
jgi:DNA-binding NarL/FixJ family response regulator